MKKSMINKIIHEFVAIFGKSMYKDNSYCDRNWINGYANKTDYNKVSDDQLLMEQVKLFKQLDISSIFDYGGGIGLSLKTHIDTDHYQKFGYGEISDVSIGMAREILPNDCKIYDLKKINTFENYDLVYTRAVIVCVHPKSIEKVYRDILKMNPKYIFMQEAYYYPEPKGANFNHKPWEYFYYHGYDIVFMKYQIIYNRDGSIRHPGQGYNLLLKKKDN